MWSNYPYSSELIHNTSPKYAHDFVLCYIELDDDIYLDSFETYMRMQYYWFLKAV